MPALETKGPRGNGVGSQVGLIVLALLAGLVVPVGVVAYLAARDPQPRSCGSGVTTAVHMSGAVAWSTPGVLWLADGDLSRSQRLADYAPARPPSPSPSPSAGAPSPEASPSPTPAALTPGAGPSPSPVTPAAAIEAAGISADHKLVAFLVSNAPDEPGKISLRYVSPQDPPGTAPTEVYSTNWAGNSGLVSQVSILPDGHILFQVAHNFDPPETETVLVGVGETGATPHLAEQDTLRGFLHTSHALWPEVKGYKLPPDQPSLQSRVIAANGRVAGQVVELVSTPLLSRSLSEVASGRAGSPETSIVCAAAEPLRTVAFAPDGHTVAVARGGATEVLNLDGNHSLAPLVRGTVLAWRP